MDDTEPQSVIFSHFLLDVAIYNHYEDEEAGHVKSDVGYIIHNNSDNNNDNNDNDDDNNNNNNDDNNNNDNNNINKNNNNNNNNGNNNITGVKSKKNSTIATGIKFEINQRLVNKS